MNHHDVLIIGAGAAGLMCATHLHEGIDKNAFSVGVLEHMPKPAEKIRISGGGRCNFTNLYTQNKNFLSENKHFCKSALARYKVQDFIKMLEEQRIAYHEKKLGQLFCTHSATDIIQMFLQKCKQQGISIDTETKILEVQYDQDLYHIQTNKGIFTSHTLVVATGGLSIPKIGATPLGYEIAKQFGHIITPLRAGLVPLTFTADILEICKELAGVSLDALVSFGKTSFQEGLLFTHRGLSGPSILQISSYLKAGDAISVNLFPEYDLLPFLKQQRKECPKKEMQTILSEILPKKLVLALLDFHQIVPQKMADCSDKYFQNLCDNIHHWQIIPAGTEGYRTAEVTIGGVDTKDISSQTMQSLKQKNLYFIGEVLDVTGHLGGFNFQWAWASGYVAACDIQKNMVQSFTF